MSEDIKILENYIYNKKETMKEQLVKAIENLIKAYKEVENENKRQCESLCKIHSKYRENNISKSLIKEKIEELEEEKQCFYSDYAIEERNNKIQVLEELLG